MKSRLRHLILKSRGLTKSYFWAKSLALERTRRKLRVDITPYHMALVGDNKLLLDLRKNSDLLLLLAIQSGGYEPASVALVESILQRDNVFVDIGANVGLFTLAALNRLRGSGHIYCFEPHPEVFIRLQRNLALNTAEPWVTPFNFALGETASTGILHNSMLEDARSSLVGYAGSSPGGLEVPVRTLDQTLPNQRVDLVKIDAEGSELSILHGMRETLRNNSNVKLLIEWNSAYADTRLWEDLSTRFHIFRVEEAGPEDLVSVTDQESLKFELCNLLCLPKSF